MTQRHHLGSGWLEPPMLNHDDMPAGRMAIVATARIQPVARRSRCAWRGAKRYVASTVQQLMAAAQGRRGLLESAQSEAERSCTHSQHSQRLGEGALMA